jgi:ABC-type uncharacterized transport system substrate-binding protein
MKRREFVALFGGAAAMWPLAARAQQPPKMPTIGFLGASSQSAWSAWAAAFVQRLRELGWIEGSTVAIQYRWAEGRSERYTEIAAEFVQLNVNVIVTVGSAARAAMQATSVIPIVFATAGDPLGLVASLARPGGNVTGLSTQAPDLAGKRVELLHEVLPDLKLLAVLGNVDYPQMVREMGEVEGAAEKLGFQVTALGIRRAEDIAPALDSVRGRAQALYVCADALTNLNRVSINTLALGAGLPTMHDVRDLVTAGGLMSYGSNWTYQFRRAAELVDKILRGVKPNDIPVEQANKFELVINLRVAKALGLSISPTLLARADEVIE